MMVNAFTSFSAAPLLLVFYSGIIILFFSLIYIFIVAFSKLVYGIEISGWSSLIISIWLLSGLIIASIGLIGIYLSCIFLEVKQRPYTIVKHIYDARKPGDL